MVFRLLFLLTILASCASTKSLNESGVSEKSVSIELFIHRPHCGGAVSSFEENGQMTIMANRKFVLKSEVDKWEIETSIDGKLSLSLIPGNYEMFSAAKSLDSAAFIRTNKRDNEYYKNAPDECYERWRTTPDFTFAVLNDTTFSLVEYNGCFTSNNPCVQYVGPMPP